VLYKFLVLYLLAGSVEDPAKSDGHYYRTISLSPLVQQHHWTSEPIVIVCDTIDIRQDRLKSALKFWEKLGYTFDSVYYAAKDDFTCARGEPMVGQIMIDIPSNGFPFGKHVGNTKTWHRTKDGEIVKVKIEIAHGWANSSRILEHEIGHALGWNDFPQTGHIMNGIWSRSGLGSKGLDKKNGDNNN
tara:strand:- start:1447 stop:2007 length:561 start_codon:yes stop_codon:yes gene_type:complete